MREHACEFWFLGLPVRLLIICTEEEEEEDNHVISPIVITDADWGTF